MAHAITSPRLTGGLALLCGIAMLPFVWSHLLGGRPEGQFLVAAALEQLHTDLTAPLPERWLLLAWLLLPIAWLLVGLSYLQASAPGPTRYKAFFLAAVAIVLASLATFCYGASTAPLFFSVPVLGAQLAFRLRRVS